MIEIQGAHNTAVCYCSALDEIAAAQIRAVCDQEEFAGCKIRIMPDVHAGRGCTIGTTMTLRDRVVPGMVGVDIGCGMETTKLAERKIDCQALDRLVRQKIPSGRDVRKEPHLLNAEIDLSELRCAARVNLERARRSIGTLGGGNHFIEVDRGTDGALYLVVHSGSRHIGTEVAGYYQDEGLGALHGAAAFQIDETIARLKAEGREREIQKTVKEMKKRRERLTPSAPKDLAYVEGRLFEDYIHDMKIIQRFAGLNRRAMTAEILRGMGWTPEETFATVHNYIDTEAMILRKGAVSAKKGEKLLIPINMRYGSLICVGKGNSDWNESAPHGAGRMMSRKKAFATLSMDEYKASMDGVFSTCVVRDTLDESPMAYKDASEIIRQIEPTAEILGRIEPVYNFKTAE
ncbi:MAG: RtcB family protein [Synergistaceae bacterium]|jgi:RNA-splicing ligase RtcB|nr:RtcB family protein [Synergistaceae bacterium]